MALCNLNITRVFFPFLFRIHAPFCVVWLKMRGRWGTCGRKPQQAAAHTIHPAFGSEQLSLELARFNNDVPKWASRDFQPSNRLFFLGGAFNKKILHKLTPWHNRVERLVSSFINSFAVWDFVCLFCWNNDFWKIWWVGEEIISMCYLTETMKMQIQYNVLEWGTDYEGV